MGRFDDAPEQYWHCYFGKDGQETRAYAMARDLSKEELLRSVITPWRERRPMLVGGTVVRDHDAITEIKIVRTSRKRAYHEEAADRAWAEAGLGAFVGGGFAAFHDGEDFTNELLADSLSARAPAADVATLLQLCARLPHAAKPLLKRRKGKDAFAINDEYDAQDLLHAIVRAYFKYVVSEEPIKKLANAKATRADFAIEALGAIVELKYVHGPDDQVRIVEDLAKDLLFYEQWEPLKVFIYVVCNASDLHDPEALDKLSGERTIGGKKYQVHIVRA